MSTQRLMKMFGWMLAASAAAGCMGGGDSGPATCKEAKSTYKVSTNGPQTLYFGGDKTMPWSAFCVGMQSDSPVEFIELPPYDAAGQMANFSGFGQADTPLQPATGMAVPGDGFAVLTHFDKVRIDPVDLTIDITDKTYTRTDAPVRDGGLISKTLNMDISFMPYGVAMQCGKVGGDVAPVKTAANINLAGLPFELVDTQMCASPGNNTAIPDSRNQNKVVNFAAQGVTAGGIMTCGLASVHCLPPPTANGQVGGQNTIPLRYASTSPTPGQGF